MRLRTSPSRGEILSIGLAIKSGTAIILSTGTCMRQTQGGRFLEIVGQKTADIWWVKQATPDEFVTKRETVYWLLSTPMEGEFSSS